MLHYWLQSALASSKMSQSLLARSLSEALGRSIDRAAVNKMVSGERRMLADELLETARICEFPLPLSGRSPSSDFQRALAVILPTLDHFDPAPIAIEQFNNNDDILQITFGKLVEIVKSSLAADLPNSGHLDILSNKIMDNIKRCIGRQQVFVAEDC